MRRLLGAVALVGSGFAAGLVWCLVVPADQAEAVPPGVVVYEDGSGVLPAGTHNSVLGDLSGRGFCLKGELCND